MLQFQLIERKLEKKFVQYKFLLVPEKEIRFFQLKEEARSLISKIVVDATIN